MVADEVWGLSSLPSLFVDMAVFTSERIDNSTNDYENKNPTSFRSLEPENLPYTIFCKRYAIKYQGLSSEVCIITTRMKKWHSNETLVNTFM